MIESKLDLRLKEKLFTGLNVSVKRLTLVCLDLKKSNFELGYDFWGVYVVETYREKLFSRWENLEYFKKCGVWDNINYPNNVNKTNNDLQITIEGIIDEEDASSKDKNIGNHGYINTSILWIYRRYINGYFEKKNINKPKIDQNL